nr:transmembrane protease serine 9-like [Penaeus vannamei]
MQLGFLLLLASITQVSFHQTTPQNVTSNSIPWTELLTKSKHQVFSGHGAKDKKNRTVREESNKQLGMEPQQGKKRQKKRNATFGKRGEIMGLFDVCEGNVAIDYEASAYVYTRNSLQRKMCKQVLKTPIGTEVGFSCLTFNLSRDGCKNEYLELNFKFDGQNAKRKYCASDGPKNIIVPTNKVLLKYFHRDNDWCSQGFLCEVHTVGGVRRPYCNGCGIAPISVDNKIVEGAPAAAKEYPFQVRVRHRTDGRVYVCGGTIVKKRWVLTAAHCLFDKNEKIATSVEVGYGSISIDSLTFVTALKFIAHPDYNNKTFANDIAVVQLPEPLPYVKNDSIQPVCLALESDIPFRGKVVATGWGHTSFDGTSPSTLHEVQLDLISISDCEVLIRLPPDSSKVLCALTPYKDTCHGDSGGPLLTELEDGRWAQVALTSYGIECARPQYPGVYTKVSAYVDWISQNTGGTDCNSF